MLWKDVIMRDIMKNIPVMQIGIQNRAYLIDIHTERERERERGEWEL